MPRLARLFGHAGLSESAAVEAVAANDFFADMPIAKMVMFGVLSEAELKALIETVNAAE
jgi:hypothetical protein